MLGRAVDPGGLLVSLRPKEGQAQPVVHLGPQHICPLGLRVGPIEPLSPSPFQMVGVDTEGLCCYLCPPVCPWGQGFLCLLI